MIHLFKKYGVQKKNILEIGCGDADFLYQLCKETQSKGIGYEPSFNGRNSLLKEISSHLVDFSDYIKVIPDFYSQKTSNVKSDLIICRHVLEHIPHPSSFVKQLYSTISSTSENALIFFEVPCLDYIVKNKCITHFIYEHCNYFSQSSLTDLFQSNGFQALEAKQCYGGAFQYIICKIENNGKSEHCSYETFPVITNDLFVDFFKNIQNQIEKESRIAIWGASNSGNIIYELLKQTHQVGCFIDSNREKVGGFMAGSGLPIYSLEKALEVQINTIIIANPLYHNELQKIIKMKTNLCKILTF